MALGAVTGEEFDALVRPEAMLGPAGEAPYANACSMAPTRPCTAIRSLSPRRPACRSGRGARGHNGAPCGERVDGLERAQQREHRLERRAVVAAVAEEADAPFGRAHWSRTKRSSQRATASTRLQSRRSGVSCTVW